MQKTIALLLLAATTLLLALGSTGTASPQLDSPGKPQWAGCYYAEWDSGLKQLFTVSTDGTWTANDINDFGLPLGDRDSTIHGVWEMTGPFQAALTGLWFQFDENGVHTATLRVRAVSQTDKDFDTFANTGTVDLFLPSQNPMLEEPFLYNVASMAGSGWRMVGG